MSYWRWLTVDTIGRVNNHQYKYPQGKDSCRVVLHKGPTNRIKYLLKTVVIQYLRGRVRKCEWVLNFLHFSSIPNIDCDSISVWGVYSNTEMSLKEELVYTPEEGSSQPVLISRSSMVLKSDWRAFWSRSADWLSVIANATLSIISKVTPSFKYFSLLGMDFSFS